jgi:hypothetical protein
MSELPVPWGTSSPSRQVARAARALERCELDIYHHQLMARFAAECDQIDARAVADVTRTALEEEMSVLDWGLQEAAGSHAKAELVSRMVSLQSKLDSARIARRFGG